MKRTISIIVFLFLGLISQAQVFYSDNLTNLTNTKNYSGYIGVTVDIETKIVFISFNGNITVFKLVDAQIKEENRNLFVTYTIEDYNRTKYTFYVFVANDNHHAIFFPDFDIIGQHLKIEKYDTVHS